MCRVYGLRPPSPQQILLTYFFARSTSETDLNTNILQPTHYKNDPSTDGIAIWSRLGRNFSCAYMRKWDEKLLEYDHKLFFYKRFIDDGFGIWDGDLKSLKDFQEYANKIHENIKIQLQWSRNQVEFLDTLVKLDNGHIYTDLYVKPTDKQLYLKLYCRYLYTRPCMINHIWGLKQLWLQVNGHAWFHLQRLRWPVRNGEGAKNSKWKYMSPAGFEPTPRQSTTGKLQRLRPLQIFPRGCNIKINL